MIEGILTEDILSQLGEGVDLRERQLYQSRPMDTARTLRCVAMCGARRAEPRAY